MNRFHMTCIALGLAIFSVLPTIGAAEDNPGEVIATAAAAAQTPLNQESLEQRWQAFLTQNNWGQGVQEGEIIIFPDRKIIVSSASVFTKVRLGQPGWIESRIVAFERAELEAKTKIIRYLSETTETARSLKLLEDASWSDGSIEEAKKMGKVEETLSRIGEKSMALSEAALDSALQELDPDYDPSVYQEKTPEQLKTIVEDKFNRHIKTMAFRTLVGVTQLYSTEGQLDGEYQVLVGVIWSPNLNRLALSLMNDEYNIPPGPPGKTVEQHVPEQDALILASLGTRIVIDENGHYTVLAFAQAQPRMASPNRIQSAIQDAKQIAADRARAMIVNYIKEGLVMRNEEESQELSREFSDMTVGTETLRQYKHSIDGRKVKIQLRGLRTLKEWSLKHPDSEQNIAGAVIAWSPASAELSKSIDNTMKNQAGSQTAGAAKVSPTGNAGPPLESMKVDTSAY